MEAVGRMSYRYFEAPGIKLDLDIGAYPNHYTVAITLNGARTSAAKRRDLNDAVRWGLQSADQQLELFGLQPRQLALGDVLAEAG